MPCTPETATTTTATGCELSSPEEAVTVASEVDVEVATEVAAPEAPQHVVHSSASSSQVQYT